ncbi:UDP-glucuronic acid decarboxylase family protein [Thioclava atlantica]|uniref:UDP-glucuronic acid decarboxylase family protein n=1 Tax=Thioclava atlantica TaxID=1317124 RepID=UPI00057099EA|nr:UDP-glucuronic acid decarboxylase family protein [Thioclava atlantica]
MRQRRRRNLRCLVTGGAGFLGSHLCDRLIEQGHQVICLDNLQTGRRRNIAHLERHPRFSFVEHDVIVPFSHSGPLDRIYNLACPASPPKYQRDPINTFQICILGAFNMLALADRKGARILQASTSEVYGDPDISPQPEEYRGVVNTVGPRSCYDEGKRAAETLFHDYHLTHGTDIRIARIFNTYGPRMAPDDGRVVSNFVTQAISGLPITIYGDGMQTRSLCYVDDLLAGMIALMESETVGPRPVNLGNPGEYTVAAIARIVREICGAQSPIIHKPLPIDDPLQRCPDITRAGVTLGWAPKVALRAGLLPTITYFRDAVLGQEIGGVA